MQGFKKLDQFYLQELDLEQEQGIAIRFREVIIVFHVLCNFFFL